MKMFLKSLVSIMVAIAFLLLVSESVKAQTPTPYWVQPPTGLPPYLPIGSKLSTLTGIVTNHCYPAFQISYYDSTNGFHSMDLSPWGTISFVSYDAYQTCMLTNGWFLYTNFIVPAKDVASDVEFYATAYDINVPGSGLDIWTNIGRQGSITMDSFRGLEPSYICPTLAIPGLTKYVIQVDSPAYSYTWPEPPGYTNSTYPPEHITATHTAFNYWYSTGTNRVRITITASGKTATYTQYGMPILPPSMQIYRGSLVAVTVTMTPGSDTTIEHASGTTGWQPLVSYPWSSRDTLDSINVDPASYPTRLFRAFSR